MSTATSITVRVPLTIRHRPRRLAVVAHGTTEGAVMATRADPLMVKALAAASRWQRMLDDGHYASIREIAAPRKSTAAISEAS